MVRDDCWSDDPIDARTLCDIVDSCDDCPKMGDDCDGIPDDKIAYYERQGDEYVYYDEDEHELFREPV